MNHLPPFSRIQKGAAPAFGWSVLLNDFAALKRLAVVGVNIGYFYMDTPVNVQPHDVVSKYSKTTVSLL